MFEILGALESDVDDRYYLMDEEFECKLAFADWVARPEQRTREIYAAFEGFLQGLSAIIEGDGG